MKNRIFNNINKTVNFQHVSILILICFCLVYGWIVIKDFSNPMIGVGDEEQWEYSGFYSTLR